MRKQTILPLPTHESNVIAKYYSYDFSFFSSQNAKRDRLVNLFSIIVIIVIFSNF